MNSKPTKSDDMRWFKVDNLPLNTIPYGRNAIAEYVSQQGFSEFGWE